MMECLYQVTDRVTFEEKKLCYWTLARRSVGGWIFFILFELLILFNAALCLLLWRFSLCLFFLAAAVIWPFFRRWLGNRNMRREYETHRVEQDGLRHYDFYPTRVVMVHSRGERWFDYAKMEGMVETKTHLYLLTLSGVISLRKEILPPGLEEFLRGLKLKKR